MKTSNSLKKINVYIRKFTHLPVYRVVITLSGPIETSSEYRNLSNARNAFGSTSGNSISGTEAAFDSS